MQTTHYMPAEVWTESCIIRPKTLTLHLHTSSTPLSLLYLQSVKRMCAGSLRNRRQRIAPGPDGVSLACLKTCADQLTPIGLNEYRPVPFTSVVMKSFKRLVLAYLKDPIGPPLVCFQANRSVDEAANMRLHVK